MKNVHPTPCITLNELKQLIRNKKKLVKIIDVRSKEDFLQYHIPGAINIPLINIEKAATLFDKKDIMIMVCAKGGGRSIEAAEKLRQLEFENTLWLCGGTLAWEERESQT